MSFGVSKVRSENIIYNFENNVDDDFMEKKN